MTELFDIEVVETEPPPVPLPECLWVDAIVLDHYGEPREPCGLCGIGDDHGLPRVVRDRLDPAKRVSACLACALANMWEFLPITAG